MILLFTFITIIIFIDHYFFQLCVYGYNDKQHLFLGNIIEKMITFEVDSHRFDILKENVSF